MKKIIRLISMVCLLAMLVGMLPVLGVSAAEAATLELKTFSSDVKQNGNFTVTLALANNPGINNLPLYLYYDPDVLEITTLDEQGQDPGAVANSIFAGKFAAAGLYVDEDQNPVYGDYSMLFAAGGISDVTENGTLAEISFKVKDGVAVGTTTEIYTVTGKTINASSQTVTVVDAAKTLTVVEENASLTTIDGAQVNLGTDISVTYKVTLDPDHAGAQMQFTTHGKVYTADPVETAEANVYKYTLKNIAPQCMGDNIKAEVMFGGVAVATYDNYSILKNCNNLKDAYPENVELNTLINDLLVYGAAAQKYQNYKTNALVVDIPDELDEFDYESIMFTEGSSHDTAAFVSCNVKFDYTNSICYKFTVPEDATESNFKIVLDELDPETLEPIAESIEYTLPDFVLVDAETNTYALYVEMSVLDYDAYYSASLYVKGSRSWGDPKQFLDYNVNSYAARMQSSENVDMANLAKALYYYGKSAVAYQNAN